MIPVSKTLIGQKKFGLNPRKPRNINLPKTFDGRIAWKNFLSPVKSQGNCGACYAFASASVLSDRFNIQSRGQVHIDLSPGKIILCDFCDFWNFGGFLNFSKKYRKSCKKG